MGEFEEKLNSILGDKEAMGQIMALAQSLGKPAPPAPKPEEETREPGWERTGAPAPESGAGEDPLSMLGSLDPRMVQMGMRLLKEYRTCIISVCCGSKLSKRVQLRTKIVR